MAKSKTREILWNYLMDCLAIHHNNKNRKYKTIPKCTEEYETRLNELRLEKQEKYNELITAVENKYENETRHQIALRYIKNAEKPTKAIKEKEEGHEY